jgi:hypothetical protein
MKPHHVNPGDLVMVDNGNDNSFVSLPMRPAHDAAPLRRLPFNLNELGLVVATIHRTRFQRVHGGLEDAVLVLTTSGVLGWTRRGCLRVAS